MLGRMGFLELLSIALSLAVDVAVVCLAASAAHKPTLKNALFVSGVFAFFHAMMPVVGLLLGYGFREYLSAYGHIIGFVLLLFVGLKMLKDSFSKGEGDVERIMHPGTLFILALATSVDALVIGFTFNFVTVNMPLAVTLIGGVTFAAGLLGMYLGNKGTLVLGSRVQTIGAFVLIGLAIKILLA
ncbi:MAG TPA: manganese efflux pump MntP family protein [Candidatus Paceibacterota bacterium]|nr:manganese efflux pump MntP family protein [Candidatus Paceibacterota bacterium]